MMTRLILILTIGLMAIMPCSAQKKKTSNGKRLKVGLVLGGGGAKGAAEVGVLKTIEKLDIPIDYIAGTSIGSIVGGLYSCGYRSAELDTLFHNQEWLDLLGDRKDELRNKAYEVRDGVTYVFGFPVHRKKNQNPERTVKTVGLIHGDNVVEMLDSMTNQPDNINFDRLPIPFRCVAVNIREFEEVELSSGNLAVAMRASMAIPGVFKPVELDSMLLVDGGMLNNLPVDVVRRMGADVVIAIDLTQNKHETKDKDIKGDNTFTKLLEWVVARPDLQKYNENMPEADVYINPDLKGYKASNFSPKKIAEMIERGEKAGKKAEKDLKALRKKIFAGKK